MARVDDPYHHPCGRCGIAPCDCGEPTDCQTCHLCAIENYESEEFNDAVDGDGEEETD